MGTHFCDHSDPFSMYVFVNEYVQALDYKIVRPYLFVFKEKVGCAVE